jgi:hypothetical protein
MLALRLSAERELAIREATPDEPPAPPGAPPLRYLLQTPVPAHWIPFLPSTVDATRGDVALERGALTDPVTGDAVVPLGRTLDPARPVSGEGYKVREEEVPRSGKRVSRLVWRSRGKDGSTHVWTACKVALGSGELTSGLRFDVAELQ